MLLANRAASRSQQPVEAGRCSQSRPVEASSRAIRSRQPVGVSSRQPVEPVGRASRSRQPVEDSPGSLKSSENRCQEGSAALGRSQVYSRSAKIAPKSSSGVPENAFRAARGAPRAPRGGPTEPPERPGAVQSESKRGSGAFPTAKVWFFGICVLVYTGA